VYFLCSAFIASSTIDATGRGVRLLGAAAWRNILLNIEKSTISPCAPVAEKNEGRIHPIPRCWIMIHKLWAQSNGAFHGTKAQQVNSGFASVYSWLYLGVAK